MKVFKLFGMLMLFGLIVLASCGKDEEKGTCSDGIKNQDETAIDCGGVCNACKVGVQGTWKSYPVAPILANFADSITATFNTDLSYVVNSYKSGAKTILTGTYTQTASGTGSIWNISLSQSSPTTLTSVGIFEISTNGTTMKYEVAQTEPAITGVTPPTAVGGFGSTSSGAFGTNNVQNYVRIN